MHFDAPKLSFARRPAEDGIPRPHVGKAKAAPPAVLAEVAQAAEVLPAQGEYMLALMTGRYDFADLAACVIDRLGAVAHLRVATLAFSRRNLDLLTSLLDSGTIRRLTLLGSKFFARHNGDVFEATLEALRSRGQHVAAARSHCKIACLDLVSGDALLMEGSPNLRTNSNIEQLVMIRDRGAHDYRAAFIDSEVARHGEADTE
jgi:hypothetical protein